MKNGAKLLEFQDEMINKSLVLPTKFLQTSTEEAYGAEALTGSLAPLPTGLHDTGSFFFQLLVSICSTVASLKQTFQGKKYWTCAIYLHFIVCEENFESSVASVVPSDSWDQYKLYLTQYQQSERSTDAFPR